MPYLSFAGVYPKSTMFEVQAFLPLTQKQVQSSIINCLDKYERFFLTHPSMLGTDPDLSPNVC